MHEAQELDAIERQVVESLQQDFPLVSRPFRQAGAGLELGEDELIATLDRLLHRKVLTRFGPMYQTERLGGNLLLAALAVPEERFDEVAAEVNALPQVAHNYRREHRLNMWFVLACADEAAQQAAILAIETVTGLKVWAFPKEREYFVGMHFAIGGKAPVGRAAAPRVSKPLQLGERDLELVRASQGGLPLAPEPYRLLGEQLGMEEGEVIERLAALLAAGAIRRIGAVPNHYAIGYRANAMAVFDVDDAEVDALGERVGALDCVSHCYRRPRHSPHWRYNLFAMLHGDSRDAVRGQLDAVSALLGEACRRHALLFSTRILKKTGMRL